jgi:ATP-dependent Clp protease adaptor protein ClpS
MSGAGTSPESGTRISAGFRRASDQDGSFEFRMMDIEMMKTLREALSQKSNPNRAEPIEKPRLDLLEKDEVKAKRPSMWNIVFYNDDYTPMDFVEFVLRKVFHISSEDALSLTLAVHTQGKGIAGIYTFEVAEQKQFEVLLMAKIEEHPLRVEVERV